MVDIPLRDTVPLEAIQLDNDLTYEEKLVKILEYASPPAARLSSFARSHRTEEESTWEREEDLRKDHPHLFYS